MADQVTTSLAQAKVLVMQGLAGKTPRVNATNNHWEVYDNDTQTWVDTGVEATGADGADGHSPYINSSGYWVVFDDGTQAWVTTDVKAAGVDGVSPTVTVTDALNGKTIKITDAEHPQGQSVTIYNGTDGHSPYADATTGTWWVYDDASGLWVDSHVTAAGTNGKSPYINSSGYWVFWNDSTGAWVVTNYKAAGTNGADGHSPYIGANGHWFAWDDNLAAYDDTGVAAQGPQGDDYVLTNQDKADIAAMALPDVTSASANDFLCLNAQKQPIWKTVPFQTPRVAMASTDTTPTIDPNKLYVFPEMATLTPTLATPIGNTIVNEYHFVFDSGATATVLTLPATVLQPDGFTVEANMHYEVSILEGAMTAQGWAVTE